MISESDLHVTPISICPGVQRLTSAVLLGTVGLALGSRTHWTAVPNSSGEDRKTKRCVQCGCELPDPVLTYSTRWCERVHVHQFPAATSLSLALLLFEFNETAAYLQCYYEGRQRLKLTRTFSNVLECFGARSRMFHRKWRRATLLLWFTSHVA